MFRIVTMKISIWYYRYLLHNFVSPLAKTEAFLGSLSVRSFEKFTEDNRVEINKEQSDSGHWEYWEVKNK